MLPQLENKLMSNLMLFIDNRLQNLGQGYKNTSSQFYPVTSDVNGYYAYAAPYKQLCNDTSIVGANVISGVYVNGSYNPVGSGSLKAINHYKGVVYFNTPLATNAIVSGNYAVKEFSIEIADKPEWKLLFETKYISTNEYNQTLSGLPLDTKTSPIIYLILKKMDNLPFAFSRINNNQTDIRAVIIGDTEFQRVAASSILQNLNQFHLPMLTGLPFDSLGNTTGKIFNYASTPVDSGWHPWIQEANSVTIPQKGDFADIVKKMGMVDFTISTVVKN